MSNYKQDFLAIKGDFDVNCSSVDAAEISGWITDLDTALQNKGVTTTDLTVQDKFLAITTYYDNLQDIKRRLNKFLEKTATIVEDAESGIINEERYHNRVEPEATSKPRETFYGFFGELRPSSIPILLAVGVFMACLSALMIFHLFGFTGQINMPPALTELPGTAHAAMGDEPLSSNPMVLGGVALVSGVAVVILAIMYYKTRK